MAVIVAALWPGHISCQFTRSFDNQPMAPSLVAIALQADVMTSALRLPVLLPLLQQQPMAPVQLLQLRLLLLGLVLMVQPQLLLPLQLLVEVQQLLLLLPRRLRVVVLLLLLLPQPLHLVVAQQLLLQLPQQMVVQLLLLLLPLQLVVEVQLLLLPLLLLQVCAATSAIVTCMSSSATHA